MSSGAVVQSVYVVGSNFPEPEPVALMRSAAAQHANCRAGQLICDTKAREERACVMNDSQPLRYTTKGTTQVF